MIDRELEAAFDDLFVGDDPPRSLVHALSRLPRDVWRRVDGDAEARQALAELVWMSNALRASAPRPSLNFADRIADAAFQTAQPARRQNWRLAMIGMVVAASVLLAVAVSLRRPQPEDRAAPGLVKLDEPPAAPAVAPTVVLLDGVKSMVPKLPAESSLARLELASLINKAETTALAQTITSPAEGLTTVGKTLGKEVKPIRDSVRDAFAFLGEFPAREKRSL